MNLVSQRIETNCPIVWSELQGVQLIANVTPVDESGQPITSVGPVRLQSVDLVEGSTQSNGRDCGCHTAVALQAMLRATLSNTSWHEPLLPAGADEQRDAAWRQYVGEACLTRQLDMLDPPS